MLFYQGEVGWGGSFIFAPQYIKNKLRKKKNFRPTDRYLFYLWNRNHTYYWSPDEGGKRTYIMTCVCGSVRSSVRLLHIFFCWQLHFWLEAQLLRNFAKMRLKVAWKFLKVACSCVNWGSELLIFLKFPEGQICPKNLGLFFFGFFSKVFKIFEEKKKTRRFFPKSKIPKTQVLFYIQNWT